MSELCCSKADETDGVDHEQRCPSFDVQRAVRMADIAALRARARELRAMWPADRGTEYVVGIQDAANYLESLPLE